MLRYVVLAYAAIIAMQFIVALHERYEACAKLSMELNKRARRCEEWEFTTDFPMLCTDIKLNPPGSFWLAWPNAAKKDVNVCVFVLCETIFSYWGLLSGGIALGMVQVVWKMFQ